MNTEPRQRFLQDKPRSGRHAELMATKEMQENLDMVMAQFLSNIPTANDQLTALANCYRMEGARAFCILLKGFSSTQASVPRRKDDNLPGNVRE